MSANDLILWLTVASLAFFIGQGRIHLRGARDFSHSAADNAFGVWDHDAADLVHIYRRHTLARLVQYYNLEELQALAFDIGLRHDQIGGNTTNTYALELLEYVERRGKLPDLLAGMR